MSDAPAKSRNNVLIITGDPLGAKMAGPAIRALNLAEQISRVCDVRVLTTNLCELERAEFEILHAAEKSDITEHESWADVIVLQGNILNVFPKLQKTKKYLVCDLYDPMHLEQLEQGKDPKLGIWNNRIAAANHLLTTQLQLGDFFLAASERQRDFWLGALATLGRINGRVYESDNTLENLMAIVPFGLPEEPPVQTRDPLRGVVDGINKDDKIIIWAGGIYNWFDPETLVAAVARVADKHANVKLFFMGTQHPHPGVPEMDVLNRTRALADELQLTGSHVIFNSEWVPYKERQNYLLSADVGASTHFDHIETRFSFRTRILDYLWAGLPVVTTAGDSFAELVDQHELGVVVPERKIAQLAEALERALFNKRFVAECKLNVETVRAKFAWHVVAAPLVSFCQAPHFAADRTYSDRKGVSHRPPRIRGESLFLPVRLRFANLLVAYRREGFAGVRSIIRNKFCQRSG
jgi:glycosyltransferase involved in cell wall biosynthesis